MTAAYGQVNLRPSGNLRPPLGGLLTVLLPIILCWFSVEHRQSQCHSNYNTWHY